MVTVIYKSHNKVRYPYQEIHFRLRKLVFGTKEEQLQHLGQFRQASEPSRIGRDGVTSSINSTTNKWRRIRRTWFSLKKTKYI